MLVGLESSLIFYFAERSTAKNFSWCSCWPRSLCWLILILLRLGCLSLLGHAITASILTLLNWTAGVSVKGLWVDLAATADLWTKLLISRQHRWELLQRPFLRRSTFFPTISGGWWLQGKLKHLKTIIKNRFWKKDKVACHCIFLIKVANNLTRLMLPTDSLEKNLKSLAWWLTYFSWHFFSIPTIQSIIIRCSC